MKKFLALTTVGLFGVSLLGAADDAKADVKAAAKKLGDNYSWTTTSKMEGGAGGGGGGGGRFGGGSTEGQTADGIVYLKSTFGDRTMHTAAKGEKVIVKGEEAWETPDADAQGPGRFAAQRMKTFKAPAAEAADLAEKAKSLQSKEGVTSGDLTEEAVKGLLTFRRPGNADAPAPKEAKGSVKFWVKEGALTKYEFNVQGKVMGRDDQEMAINRTTTIEIKDAGKTKLALPEDAKKKL